MPYKISGTKNETARIIVINESDWSIEANTIVSGSGSYEIEYLFSGHKWVIAGNSDGMLLGYGSVDATYYYMSGDRGIIAGSTASSNVMDYITISTTGNGSDFGDLTVGRTNLAATSNHTNNRGVFAGGIATTNTIDYITISSTGNATNFSDLTLARGNLSATSNGTNERGVFCGGSTTNVIDYITINSISDATDFGDLLSERIGPAATSNA